ncbi:MAG: PaaI family thioesterase [Propionibacteriaceae bacterium]|jgi:acyl-coenzyme A thioesterase PaaI-like protein|nr:PaaI family thioesterase [Propionibacteriaceae bacterium]
MKSIQERYPEPYTHCFGCGTHNQAGWHIQTYYVDGVYVGRHRVPPEYSGGWADSMYGGAIAALIDCHTAAAAADAKGRELGLTAADPLPRFVTATITVDYLAPTPAGVEVNLKARVTSIAGRKVHVSCELFPAGSATPTARGEVLMIQVREP